jgi:DNA-binding transcriptional regulator YdaS (Cro superfamily)
LTDLMKGRDLDDTDAALVACSETVTLDRRVASALRAVAASPALAIARAQLGGVSERSLQRLLLATTGRPPTCWRLLARWRAATRSLVGA